MRMLKKKQEKLDKIKKIKKNIAEAERIMEKNLDLLIQRGEKLELIEDRSAEIEKNALEFTQQARQLSIWAQFKHYHGMAILAGMTLGALYGVVSGWYWPFLIASVVAGGTMGYSLVWMLSGITQSFFRFKFWSSSPEMSQREVSTQTFEPSGVQYQHGKSYRPFSQFERSQSQEAPNEDLDQKPSLRAKNALR